MAQFATRVQTMGRNFFNSPRLKVLLEPDTAGPTAQRVYEYSSAATAAIITVCVFSSNTNRVVPLLCEPLLDIAVPIHSYIGVNAVISDYVPLAMRPASRWACLGAHGLMFAGLSAMTSQYGLGPVSAVKYLWSGSAKPLKPLSEL